MDSGQDTRRSWLVKGLAALGVGGVVAVGAASRPSSEQAPSREPSFDPTKGEIVRLTLGRGLKSEVLARYPGESDIDTATKKLSKASGPGAGSQANVDQFLPKEAPSKWVGEYIGFAEGSLITKGYKVDTVEPDKRQVTLEVTANGKTDKITVSTDYTDPQNTPFSFKDEEGNSLTVVAALGRKREEIKGGINPDTVQIADRVVIYKAKSKAAST